MAVHSTQGQNRAVRSTPGGWGVSPSFITVIVWSILILWIRDILSGDNLT